MVGFRGHLSNAENPKSRGILISPFDQILAQQHMMRNIHIKMASHPDSPFFFGQDCMKKIRYEAQYNIDGSEVYKTLIDYDKFDKNLGAEIIEASYNILEKKIAFNKMTIAKTNKIHTLSKKKEK